ncbi:MAG: hypothetical protein Q8L98_03455 [Chlamydiales bacterium]|nr:hypothetical protein [Chlamydiales bacterium]
MTLIKSILLGREGSYNICGIAVQFKNNDNRGVIDCLKGAGVISQIAINCLNSSFLRVTTFGYAHVLTHEMGHALTARLLINDYGRSVSQMREDYTKRAGLVNGSEFPEIQISVNNCTGTGYYPLTIREAPAWKRSIIDVAGPAAGIGFSIMQLLAASQLKKLHSVFFPLF